MTTVVPVSRTAAHGVGPWGYGHPAGWFPFFPIVGFLFFLIVLVLVVGFVGRRRWRGGPWGGAQHHPWSSPAEGPGPHRGQDPVAYQGQPPGAYAHPLQAAEAELARRFAVGELDEAEYASRLATLRRMNGVPTGAAGGDGGGLSG